MQIRQQLLMLIIVSWLVACTPTLEPVVSERPTVTPTPTFVVEEPTPILATATPTAAPLFMTPTSTPPPIPVTPTRVPPPTPTPLNPLTDLPDWVPFYSSDLRLALRYPPEWQASVEPDGALIFRTHFTESDLETSQPDSSEYRVTVTSIPNPQGLPFDDMVADWVGGALPADFTYDNIVIGPFGASYTTDVPVPGGAATVFLEGNGRFVAFALSPFSDGQPYFHQPFFQQLFDAMLFTVQLDIDADEVQRPTPVPTPFQQYSGYSIDPVISANGRFIAFRSTMPLTANAEPHNLSVFVQDTESNTIELVSRTMDGQDLEYDVYGMAMSGNGQVVAYYSFDGNIVPDDEFDCGSTEFSISCEDLFIYDRSSGETIRIPLGRPQGLGSDYSLAVSGDGRFVAYGHQTNLWVYDRESGTAVPQLISITGGEPEAPALAPAFSADGRYLAFVSPGADLVPNDTNETYDVFLLDRETGGVTRISTAIDGGNANAHSGVMTFHEGFSASLAISADGRFIAFASLATNLTGNVAVQCKDYRDFTRACYQIYLHDREAGTTRLVTVESDGDSMQPALSADGRFLSFSSRATNLTYYSGQPCNDISPGAGCPSIYLYDQELGSITFLSMGPDVVPANGSSYSGNTSADGRYLVFSSSASNLVPGNNNSPSNVYRLDRQTATVELISGVAGSR